MNAKNKYRAWDGTSMMYSDMGSNNDSEYWDGVKNSRVGMLNNLLADNDLIWLEYSKQNDNRGSEIYEGDILSPEWKGVVYRDNKTGTFMVMFNNHPFYHNKRKSLYNYLKQRRKAGMADVDNVVIGNIYENPELIK